MKQFLQQSGIPFDGDYIRLPDWCKRVKLDVGLSENAPHSGLWLGAENDLVVFGFEPVRKNIKSIKSGMSTFPHRLNPDLINDRFFLIPCALGDVQQPDDIPFFVTSNDSGCSSALRPIHHPIDHVETVPIYSLRHFLQYFPWHRIPHIEYLKTDCQGTDIDVLKGAGEFIDRICVITSEPETVQYRGGMRNSLQNISDFLLSKGFLPFATSMAADPTFRNSRLEHIPVVFSQLS